MDFNPEIELFTTAENYFMENRYAQAEPILNQLVLKNTKKTEVFHMLGTIYYDQGKFNKAIRAFRRSLEIDPHFTDASIGLSIILNDLGRYEEGQKVFDEARSLLASKTMPAPIEKPEEIIEVKSKAINEQIASKHNELGTLYFDNEQPDEALMQFKNAYGLTLISRPEYGIKIVDCYIKLNQSSIAIRELKSLVRDFPNFILGRIKLGSCYFESHQIPEAIEQLEIALKFDPNNEMITDLLQQTHKIQSTRLSPVDAEL